MKKINLLLVFLIGFLFVACDKTDSEIFENKNSGINYRELSASEQVLKSQLSETAKIITEIIQDNEVLDEIIISIKNQPQVMEDRVKFKDLMESKEILKSKNLTPTKSFSSAFKANLNKSNLKSATTLIEDLIAQGIEIYIPYPIDYYKKDTKIVITSDPLDNLYENEGFFIGNTDKKVLANDELSEKYPIIIVNTPMYSDEELASMAKSRKEMDEKIEEVKKLKSNKINLKSVNSDPTSDWDNELKHYGTYIPKIYCYNDHVSGLFAPNGYMYITSGTVTFDTSTKIVVSEINKGTYGFSLPRKLERDCNNGYSRGWFDCNVFLWEDWQPAITQNSITIFIDTPNLSTTNSGTLKSDWLQKITATVTPVVAELSKSLGVSATTSTVNTTKDYVYASKNWGRDRYKQDYPTTQGVVWGEVGETTMPVAGIGQRPALRFSTELLYLTYVENW